MTEPKTDDPTPDRLIVSGIEIEVSNPALAASLSEEFSKRPAVMRPAGIDQRTVTEGVPETVVTLPTPRTEAEERLRRELRARVAAAGLALGFEVASDSTWTSETGVTIVTRVNERPVTPAAAVHFVGGVERSAQTESGHGSVLFVVTHPGAVASFAVAIRHRETGDHMRAIGIDDLERLAALCRDGRVRHREAAAILSPVSAIDAGSLVDVVARALDREGE